MHMQAAKIAQQVKVKPSGSGEGHESPTQGGWRRTGRQKSGALVSARSKDAYNTYLTLRAIAAVSSDTLCRDSDPSSDRSPFRTTFLLRILAGHSNGL